MPPIEIAIDLPELEVPQADIEMTFVEIESDLSELQSPQTLQKPAHE